MSDKPPHKPYLTTGDVAALLGVSAKTVQNMVERGELTVRQREPRFVGEDPGPYRPFIFERDENPTIDQKLREAEGHE